MSLSSMNRIALTRIAAVRTLHLSASSVRLPRFANPPQRDPRRAEFSTTPRRNATEDESFKSVAEKQQKLKRVLEQHPQLKEDMKALFEALKAEGIDFTKSLPSRVQMLGLVFKPNVRDALAKVAAGLQEAGVNPQEMQDDLMKIAKYWKQDPK